MKWLTNTYDPSKPEARNYIVMDISTGETRQEAWKSHLNWLKGKVIGLPKATDTYTIKEMQEMNLVGVYLP